MRLHPHATAPRAHPCLLPRVHPKIHQVVAAVDLLDLHASQVRQQPIDPHEIARPATLAREAAS